LARNENVFASRGVQLLAISVDTVAQSKTMAAKIGLSFPVVQDASGDISRQFVGIDDADISIPGVVVVAKGGAVVFRHVATSKDDRISTTDLLKVIDDKLAVTGSANLSIDHSFQPLNRWQIRTSLGGGVGNNASFVSSLTVGAMFPATRHLLLGAEVRTSSRSFGDIAIATNANIAARFPFWNDLAALHVGASAGIVAWSSTGTGRVSSSVASEVWFAVRPTLAILVGLQSSQRWRSGDVGSFEVSATVGAAYMFMK
jgi:hypothetical protein